MPKHDCVVLYNSIDYPSVEDDFFSEANVRDEVSAVEESLRELGFHPYLLEIDRVDRDFVSLLARLAPRFVFNLCEGLQGRSEMEMCVAALLELLGIPYTGSPPLALGLALNKHKAKQILAACRIPTPRAWVVRQNEAVDLKGVIFPVIVKPIHEDASVGIHSGSVVDRLEDLERRVQIVHKRYQQSALVEQFIDGRELNVSILGCERPQVLPISEIDFSNLPQNEPRIVSYKAKWDPSSPLYQSTVPICPAKLPPKVESRIKAIAVRAFREIGCRDYARVDFRLDRDNKPYVLEVNPNPDISPNAGLARSARTMGLSYTDLIGRIVESALARGGKEAKLEYAS